jgi:glycosyltransferase involved in cell wall biosynthesis
MRSALICLGRTGTARYTNGLPTSLYAPGCGDGGYLAFIGRICPEKRPDWAIEIARRAGRLLTIAAKVDKVDRSYYKTRIKPLLKDPGWHFDLFTVVRAGLPERRAHGRPSRF